MVKTLSGSSSSHQLGIRLLNFSQKLSPLSSQSPSLHENEDIISNATLRFARTRLSILIAQDPAAISALFSSIAGHSTPYFGDILINNVSVSHEKEKAVTQVFYVSPKMPIHFAWTLDKVSEAFSLYYPHWNHSAYFYWIRNFRMSGSTRYAELNDEKRQQALLAMALSSQAEVLLIEDLEKIIDRSQREEIYMSLLQRAKQGSNILISSQKISFWLDKQIDLYRIKNATIEQINAKDLKQRLLLKNKKAQSPDKYWTPDLSEGTNSGTQTQTML